jgi:hypothetical protein
MNIDNLHRSRALKQNRQRLYLSEEMDIFDPAKTRGQMRFDRKFFAYRLAKLELFIEELMENDEMPFLPWATRKGIGFSPSPLAEKHASHLSDYLSIVRMLPDRYEFSEYIEVFRTVTSRLNITEEMVRWDTLADAISAPFVSEKNQPSVATFNHLVSELRIECAKSDIREKMRQRHKEADKRYREYCHYVDALFFSCSRLVAIRLDLSFSKEHEDAWTLDQAKSHLQKFHRNRQRNRLFEGWMGYVAKLEYGIEKGLHIHLLIFFNGHVRRGSSHIHLAEQIGEYWVKVITKSMGTYWNCNANAEQFKRLSRMGVGDIQATDNVTRHNLKSEVLMYLCKSSQFLRNPETRGEKLITRGDMPKQRHKKRGRPRNSI